MTTDSAHRKSSPVLMTDNFDLLAKYINANKTLTEDQFLFLQIIKRRKDNPESLYSQETIKNMHLKSAEDMLERKEVIVDWCQKHNARAYLRLNLRDKRKIALRALAQVAENIANENWNIKNCYESAVGKHHQDPKKTWVIDIDFDEIQESSRLNLGQAVYQLVSETPRSIEEIEYVPTPNGYHIITPPFNVAHLGVIYKETPVAFHKDNPTILACPRKVLTPV